MNTPSPSTRPPRKKRIPPLENGDRLTREEFERRYEAMPHIKKAELIEGVVYMPSLIRVKEHGEPGRIPPLENGDRLTREEFERRYGAMPHIKKAELIEGVVYMPSPTRVEEHGEPHLDFDGWLAVYRAYTPGVRGAADTTVRLDLDNEPKPDGLLFIDPALGGQAKIDEDGYLADGPEWVGEVSASTASYDLHAKFNVYRRNRVGEYVVWRVLDEAIDWFVLRGSEYQRLAPNASGIYQSEVFPGLWLDPAAMIRGDLAAVLAVLQQGIASPEHGAFVARLQATKST